MENLLIFLDTIPGFTVIVAIIAAVSAAARVVMRKSEYKKHSGLLATLTVTVLTCAVLLFLSFGFPVKGEVSAAVVPRLWIFLLLAFCAYIFVQTLRGEERPDPAEGHVKLAFFYIGMTICYIALIGVFGFFFTSILFLAAGIRFLGYSRWSVIVTVVVGWIAMSYFVFYRLLYVPFPEGIVIQLLGL